MEFIVGPKCDENTAKCAEEILRFTIGDFHLQEPMALVTNWMIAITAFTLFFKLKRAKTAQAVNWRKFYLLFGISVFFGGLGHLLFYYFDVYGKYPCWILGVTASFYAGKAMISNTVLSLKTRKNLLYVLVAKCTIFGVLGLIFSNFLFVTGDAVISYLFYVGVLGAIYWNKGLVNYKWFVFAILVLLPSIFIFLLRLSPHVWFNKEDLSHILMIFTIILFYFGASAIEQKDNGLLDR